MFKMEQKAMLAKERSEAMTTLLLWVFQKEGEE